MLGLFHMALDEMRDGDKDRPLRVNGEGHTLFEFLSRWIGRSVCRLDPFGIYPDDIADVLECPLK